MAYDFILIGATGIQGRIVSQDLLEKGYKVLLCGRKRFKVEHLLKKHPGSAFHYIELKDQNDGLQKLHWTSAPILINCAEGDYNLKIQKWCLAHDRHYLDLGSDVEMTRRQFALDSQFKKRGLIAVTGCGSVPGIGNVMLRHASKRFDHIKNAKAGFFWNANKEVFVVPFSIESIIEEFTESPTMVHDHTFKKVKPQSQKRLIVVPGIGRQQMFMVRHPEYYTFYRYLRTKGIKSVFFYAGFPEFSYDTIMGFIKAGLGSKEPFPDGHKPIELLTHALHVASPPRGYREKERLWVTIDGTLDGKPQEITMACIVPTLDRFKDAGCNIDTGIPCSLIAQMIHKGEISQRGSRSPEFFIEPHSFFKMLARYHMIITQDGRRVN